MRMRIEEGKRRSSSSACTTVLKGGVTMLRIKVICPECMKEFEADPLAIEYDCPECGVVFSSGENPLGTDPVEHRGRTWTGRPCSRDIHLAV